MENNIHIFINNENKWWGRLKEGIELAIQTKGTKNKANNPPKDSEVPSDQNQMFSKSAKTFWCEINSSFNESAVSNKL